MDYSTRIEEAEKRQRPGEQVEEKESRVAGHSRNLPNWETENGDSRSLSCYAGARRDGLWSSFAATIPSPSVSSGKARVSTSAAMFFPWSLLCSSVA